MEYYVEIGLHYTLSQSYCDSFSSIDKPEFNDFRVKRQWTFAACTTTGLCPDCCRRQIQTTRYWLSILSLTFHSGGRTRWVRMGWDGMGQRTITSCVASPSSVPSSASRESVEGWPRVSRCICCGCWMGSRAAGEQGLLARTCLMNL